ncbi:glycoside hydrolase domain-containing protein [Mycobacterium sp. 4D054]|uniref:glycoside hydrolase domain-containing protein n=1 Tax=Mycobacterium sp. 4D054 TaxID=3457440 RepID=UPI003FD6267F
MNQRFWPMERGYIITSPFGPRWGNHHAGVDFGWPGGSANRPVFACAGGRVIHSGAAAGYGGPDPAGWLVIDHPTEDGGGTTEYGHIVREVADGARVEAGQRIGHINPNQATNGGVAPHLHLSVMPRGYDPNQKIDPLPWLRDAAIAGESVPAEPVGAAVRADLVGKELVDYSAGVPGAQAIKDAGFVGAVRYVSDRRANWMQGKPLTRAEAEDFTWHGLQIVSNYQFAKGGFETSDWIRGSVGGKEDALRGQAIHEAAGGHPRGVIYVSIDAAPTQVEWETKVKPYLAAWQESLGKERLGVYCNPWVIDRCREADIATYFWEHGWGGDKDAPAHPAAHIKQFEIDKRKVNGIGVDRNRILKPLFGQWGTEEETMPAVVQEQPKDTVEQLKPLTDVWRGDPVWLPDVLRLWGLTVTDIGNPLNDGHGDFREVRGVIGHHTAGGGVNDWKIVKHGRADLKGPLAQLVLEKDGTFKFIAVGVCWHAGGGKGSAWASKFSTEANWYTIGIEAVSRGTPPWDWTPEQLRSYKCGVAAILWYLGKDASWFCGHREYNLAHGKIDPAGIDLDQFRRELQELIDRGPEAYVNAGPQPGVKTRIEAVRDANEWLGDKIIAERELSCPDGSGRYAHYEHGSIYFHSRTGTFAVPKPGICDFWASVGWETSFLGYPTDDAVKADRGTWQSFEHGAIYHRNGDDHAWPVYGGIGETWRSAGGQDGKFGWPQSREIEDGPDTVYQRFENGRIFWRFAGGPVSSLDTQAEPRIDEPQRNGEAAPAVTDGVRETLPDATHVQPAGNGAPRRAWDGIWRVGVEPLSGDQVRLIQRRALLAFGSYSVPLGVQLNGTYDAATAAFVEEFQSRKNASGYQPRLPANPNARPGDCDFETKKALGILPTTPTPGTGPKYVGYAVPGTWGTWNIGPQCMAVNRHPEMVHLQGVGYNTSAFLNPDPQHSYVEAREEGTAELLRLALPDPRPKFLSGYSMGADVVVRFLHAWPADRQSEIVGVFTFGSPGRPPGVTKLGGPDPGGAGISGVYTPEIYRDREWSYTINGDMYSEATALLPALYDILTRMELSPAFVEYLFTWLTGIPLGGGNFGLTAPANTIGSGLLGLNGNAGPGSGALSSILGMVTPGPLNQTSGPISLPAMLMNIPGIVMTLVSALKFVVTGAHGKYWVDRTFDGMNAEDHAASVVRRLAV